MKRSIIIIVVIISLLLTSCGKNQVGTSPLPTEHIEAQTATLAPTPTATQVPPRVLNICMAEEPAGLYRYDGSESRAKQSVFAAIYIDLFEENPETKQSLFFESIPTEENGGILVQATPVRVGQPVLDASGNVVYLAQGTKIEHAISVSVENPVVWNFEQEYQMNQVTVTFNLLPELKWSDGEALISKDFVFAYHLAERSRLGHYQWAVERTDSLVAVDENTLVWTGIPGFVPRNLKEIFWQPMPSHVLGELSDSELLVADMTTRLPAGWGAYRIVDWLAGSQIVLEKNPNFVLADQNLPGYDKLVFQVEPDLDAALQKLESGQCDVLDKTYQLEALTKSQLETLSAQNTLIAENWEPIQQLVFGIQPAAYDDGLYSQWSSERQNILGNLETRKAIAACLDANSLLREYLATRLPDSIQVGLETQETSVVDPAEVLEEIGWKNPEESQEGIRVAQSVNGVLDGTELRLGLLTGQSNLDKDIAGLIGEKLARCGIAIDTQAFPVSELYRPGPDGLVFGRNFELALISWQPEHVNLCQLYTSDQIPNSINSWVGTNLSGFKSEEFDEACWGFSTWMLGEQGRDNASLMAEFLPAVALMPHYRLWVASPRILLPENTTFLDLWKFVGDL